jgi:adenine-specific DNA-methyltransferase
VSVEATTHTKASRKNIPTAELEAFAKDAEPQPAPVLYPRDPSLDPQLVWKGKAEQDAQPLAVPSVPIYIQEKIAPRAIIEDLRAASKREHPDTQLDLFGDFNGLEFEQAIEFYQHDQHWSNRMILGDSLLVMNSLVEKEGLRRQVQMIYLDPPYGIRFGSNWQVSTRKLDVRDGRSEDATRQPEQVRAFRDTWQLGVHSYLSYLRDRLAIARELLTETGSIFVQIGDENVHLVRSLMDEVFGSENFASLITVKKTNPLGASGLGAVSDYLLWYTKSLAQYKFRRLLLHKELGREGVTGYAWVELPNGDRRRLTAEEFARIDELPNDWKLFAPTKLTAAGLTPSCVYTFEFDGKVFSPRAGTSWRTNAEGMKRVIKSNRLIALGDSIYQVMYFDDYPVTELTNLWSDTRGEMDRTYVVQTATKIVERCLLMSTDPGDLVLDPTCGSGTTAFVAEQWGRRWITVDTSRVALALARTRLMGARYPYYLLRDSPAGLLREAEVVGQAPPSPLPSTTGDIRQGFVYERVPHVTLKSIAQNPEITDELSQGDVAAAIARHADSELLYDRPHVASRTVRVTGPFTTESLSPHRVLESKERSAPTTDQDGDSGKFLDLVLDNLRKAGVQNTVRNERLVFDRLEQWPGVYLQGVGNYTENKKTKKVAVAIGPEYGTVGRDFVREAAKEAVDVADTLVICGFAFDAHAQDVRELGRLTILRAKMNPDLAMGDELLKKTGSGNLFMVFGEPDIDIRPDSQGQYIAEIRGVDVYDPTTGQVRSHSTDDIATWFIDTNYDEQSFFVRHAYFLGSDDPFEKLKRVLRADIDESAWSTLYRTVSRPFLKPATGKIAIKVINHYGDEVLKVYQVS